LGAPEALSAPERLDLPAPASLDAKAPLPPSVDKRLPNFDFVHAAPPRQPPEQTEAQFAAPPSSPPSGPPTAELVLPSPLGPTERPPPNEIDEALLPAAHRATPEVPALEKLEPQQRSSLPAIGAGAAIAIVIDDVGPAHGLAERAAALPGLVTLSFLPYAEGLGPLVTRARNRGHEIYLHMPMEPLGSENPGPNALLAGMSPDMMRERLEWAIGRVPGAVGVNNHMGSRLTSDPSAMGVVMDVLHRHGLEFVDSRTTGGSVAAAAAAAAGMPHTWRDVFIDHEPTEAFARHQLAAVEAMARQHGTALAIGHPLPVTLKTLEQWIPAAQARGFTFVSASDLIARRGCDGSSPAGRCGLLLTAARRISD
jgi:polysaccharide deacetylase 2 family uncharacterized protein YibQ